MKELTDIELKNASIADLTDDIELIRRVLERPNFTFEDVKKWNDTFRIRGLFMYGVFVNDDAFLNRIEKIFGRQYRYGCVMNPDVI